MHLLINDYAGHEFPIHLGKELVKRGTRVTHAYCASNVTPHGDFEAAKRRGLELKPIDLGRQFQKHRPLRRAIDEIDYGVRSATQLRSVRPDQTIVAQLPILSLLVLQIAARALRIPMVLWLQDIQAEIAQSQSARIAGVLRLMENLALRRSQMIVTISSEMASSAQSINRRADVRVIENWADVEEIKPGIKTNSWSTRHGLDQTFNFVYSGTLGIKHRPSALIDLALSLKTDENVQIVVVSEGMGTEQLKELLAEHQLENVRLLPLQPAEELQEVLASADVMLALLEEDAAAGCVPSKILAYHAAGRPILALVPSSNLANQIINNRSCAGFAVESINEFTLSARRLLESTELRASMGANARAYSERTFDIRRIADQFEDALNTNRGESHVHSN